MDCLNYFNEGPRHYRASDRDRGIASFRGALSANEGDKLSSIYIDRRIELQQNPPREWNGIWHLKSQ